MSLTSKSPHDVAREALAAGTAALTPYSHKFIPKVFTQPQLLACPVLKKLHKTDYRRIVGILRDYSDLREILELLRVPHYTTLRKPPNVCWLRRNSCRAAFHVNWPPTPGVDAAATPHYMREKSIAGTA